MTIPEMAAMRDALRGGDEIGVEAAIRAHAAAVTAAERLEWLAARISGQKEPDPGNAAKSGTMPVVEIVGSAPALKSIASRINDTISQIEGMLY